MSFKTKSFLRRRIHMQTTAQRESLGTLMNRIQIELT